jgi:hypothetical protein
VNEGAVDVELVRQVLLTAADSLESSPHQWVRGRGFQLEDWGALPLARGALVEDWIEQIAREAVGCCLWGAIVLAAVAHSDRGEGPVGQLRSAAVKLADDAVRASGAESLGHFNDVVAADVADVVRFLRWAASR